MAVSGKACHEAGKRLSVALVDAGPHRFKNIEEPIHVWTWQPAGSDASSPAPKASTETSVTNLPAQYRTAIVGVLPFANLSESADEYFSDGLTEDLIHALVAAIVLPGAEPELDLLVQGQERRARA